MVYFITIIINLFFFYFSYSYLYKKKATKYNNIVDKIKKETIENKLKNSLRGNESDEGSMHKQCYNQKNYAF